MVNALVNALVFLINSLCDLYVLALIARFLLAYARAGYFNPMSRFLAKISDPLLRPLKAVIPAYKGMEIAILVLIVLVLALKFILIGLLTLGFPNPLGLLILIFAEWLKLACDVFFYAILAQVILSWVPYSYNELYHLLALITAPVMRPLHRLIPPVGGFDITPIPALIGLKFLEILLIDPIYALGLHLSFRG